MYNFPGLTYSDVSAEYILQSRVHILLVGLMTFESELIVGPALMATVHISLYDQVKPEVKYSLYSKLLIVTELSFILDIQLILAGVLPALLKIFVNTTSQLILTQACKLCASLALHPPNKAHLGNKALRCIYL